MRSMSREVPGKYAVIAEEFYKEHEASGISISEFAEKHGYNANTLRKNIPAPKKKKTKKQEKNKKKAPCELAEKYYKEYAETGISMAAFARKYGHNVNTLRRKIGGKPDPKKEGVEKGVEPGSDSGSLDEKHTTKTDQTPRSMVSFSPDDPQFLIHEFERDCKPNERQLNFFCSYLSGLSVRQAAEQAGYSDHTVCVRYMKLPKNYHHFHAAADFRNTNYRALIAQNITRQEEILDYDLTNIIQVVVQSCRYCHGINNQYQWIDKSEYEREAEEYQAIVESGSKPRRAKPSAAGGFGFNSLNPVNMQCTRCKGVGYKNISIKPTREWTKEDRRNVEAIKLTKDGGIELKVLSKEKAHSRLHELSQSLVSLRAKAMIQTMTHKENAETRAAEKHVVEVEYIQARTASIRSKGDGNVTVVVVNGFKAPLAVPSDVKEGEGLTSSEVRDTAIRLQGLKEMEEAIQKGIKIGECGNEEGKS